MIGAQAVLRCRPVHELVANPTYEVATTLGSELITNGNFASGTTGWSFGTGWSVVSGAARCAASTTAGVLEQSLTLTEDELYRLQFTVSTVTGTNWTFKLEAGNFIRFYSGNFPGEKVQTYTIQFQAQSASESIKITAWTPASNLFAIDDVSVKEILTKKIITCPQWYAHGIVPDKGDYDYPTSAQSSWWVG